MSGYQLVDPDTGSYLARDAPLLAERGLHVAGVAGAQFREAALAAAELAPDLDAGRPWSAVVLREQRPSPRDPRSGATMLLAAADAIELRVRGR